MDKYKKVKNILLFILVANLVVAFLKLIVGGYINSSSVLADGFLMAIQNLKCFLVYLLE